MPIISVENLSKVYQIGGGTRHNSLRDSLVGFFRQPLRKNQSEEFWALRDISFTVNEGETVGIIGNNGAGKSTLLKILSRITKPTRGTATLHGRVGSLLEVGTGFHAELSGRENIFLNGAILGMKRNEIEKNFDEIVAFSEIERFLDTPVKHYSSGMYMRLAFSVAAHLNPEILIVDEVLAVGDIAFQKKCLSKMNDIANAGRTVLFVSHNSSALHRLCKTALYLENGCVKNYGAIAPILAQYHSETNTAHSSESLERKSIDDVPEQAVRFIEWRLVDSTTKQNHTIYSRDKALIEFTLVSKRISPGVHFYLTLTDEDDNEVLTAHNLLAGVHAKALERKVYFVNWEFALPLKSGKYRIKVEIHSAHGEGTLDCWEATPELTVLPFTEFEMPREQQGILNTPISFELKSAD